MKARVRRRQNLITLVIVVLFVFGLVYFSTAWPKGFTAFIAIGGTVGALLVLYEVRQTKQLAQAEFIRELQNSFANDPQIGELWRKLLLDEQVTGADRHLMSSYLTFFETIHLLHSQGALNLGLIDDLFRNRFFTAVGHPAILREALLKSVSSFTNIHELVAVWYTHLVRARKPIPAGYYAYLRAVLEAKGFEVVALGPDDLDRLLALQDVVQAGLGSQPWLRQNTREAFAECLQPDGPHYALGAVLGESLVAAAVLFDGGTGKESIRHYFTDDQAKMRSSINLKLVLADPSVRRKNTASTLVKLLEQHAVGLGRKEILCTIHPRNLPSRTLFSRLGYRRVGRVPTEYGGRLAFSRPLTSIDLHSIR